MSEAPNTEPELIPDASAVAPDGAPQAEAQGDEPDYEAEALAMGWKPPERFKGAKDDFIDAKTYVERGKTILPFLRNELKRRDREIEGLKKGLETSIKHISRADERAYAKAKAEYEAELAQYAEAGDKAGVKAVTDDLIALERERVEGPKAEANEHPDFTAWKADNEWFGEDRALTAAFNALCEEVREEGYTTPKAGLKEATARLKEAFPAKFTKPENPNRRLPGAVEGANGHRPRGGKTYADLPPEAKAMCDEFVRDIPGFTREKYLKTYDWS